MGEDAGHYRRITQQIVESVSPTDIIEHFWVRDIADLIWETLRLRRLKGNLLQTASHKALKRVLRDAVGFPAIEQLVKSWSTGDASSLQRVDDLLKGMSLSFDAVYAEALAERVGEIERIDRLIASAESRRNTVLREISRHRDAVALRLARASAAIEDAEFAEVRETDEQRPVQNGEPT
ncbi:hypothetical protein [Methylobacterium iners]|uniref:KfrA N-terminal DNA-binding domain-containing protein n=1 Tax=Methylobacterium iners TaxID=418707 RepID=A0ABQ4RTB0_9HYPH|nr:hypothetical protein [Methylobacterium iners]GJD93939.1 hypothetical protein OCOJLMKI_1137 [Methylobacterium iners]